MTTSQNGWSVSTDKSNIGVKDFKVEGVSFPGGVRSGDVATVLGYVAEQFHEHVEKLHAGWCWGYDYKPIEGSSTISNHASGTAIDINAPKHPMGVHGTFTSAQVAAINKILSFCGGVVRWGGNYTGRKDEMHFEINAGSANVAKLAAKIKGTSTGSTTPPPVTKPPTPTGTALQKGSTGAAVRNLQQFFHDTFPAYRNDVSVQKGTIIGVDGVYGDQTVAWVKEFQSRVGLHVDGIAGSSTIAQMRHYGYQH